MSSMNRFAAYLSSTQAGTKRQLDKRRRYAANLADLEPTPKPKPREPLTRCLDCGGLVYRRRPCTSPFCA